MSNRNLNFKDGFIGGKNKYLVLNHTRKTFHWSDNGFCYREDDKNGKEVTYPGEKFDVYSGSSAINARIPLGYKES